MRSVPMLPLFYWEVAKLINHCTRPPRSYQPPVRTAFLLLLTTTMMSFASAIYKHPITDFIVHMQVRPIHECAALIRTRSATCKAKTSHSCTSPTPIASIGSCAMLLTSAKWNCTSRTSTWPPTMQQTAIETTWRSKEPNTAGREMDREVI